MSESWNTCPACEHITDVSEDGQPGERFDCSNCGEPLVAEAYGEGDETEWHLLTAEQYDEEDVA